MPNLRRTVRVVELLEPRYLLSGYTFSAATFDSRVGTLPSSNLVSDLHGNLYGVLSQGGASGAGAIFELPNGSSQPILLASFSAAATGSNPGGTIAIDALGDIFGTTQSGGGSFGGVEQSAGTVFELPHAQTQIQSLYSFGNTAALPNGVAFNLATGELDISTVAGGVGYNQPTGAFGVGGVFKLSLATHTLTSLGDFDPPTTGSTPRAALTLDAEGNLFGTTSKGGAGVTPGGVSGNGYGTVFEIAAGTSTISTIAAFSGDNGAMPLSPLLIGPSDLLYGEASQGGDSFVANDPSHPGFGDIFSVTPFSNSINVVASFNSFNGADPLGGLTQDTHGNLFGTTYQGGASGDGTAFEIGFVSSTFPTLRSFASSDAGGANPSQGLYLDAASNLWGVTDSGTLFALTADGSEPLATRTGQLSATLVKTTLPLSTITGPKLLKTATVRITNTTGSATKGRTTVRLMVVGPASTTVATIGTRTLSVNLKPNASTLVSVPIKFDTRLLGTKNLTLVTRVTDSKGATNQASTGRTFDSIAATLSFDLSNLTASPASVSPGKTATYSLTLRNVGNVSTSNFGDKPINCEIVLANQGELPTRVAATPFKISLPFAPGAIRTLKIRWKIPKQIAAGSYLLVANVAGTNPATFTAKALFTIL